MTLRLRSLRSRLFVAAILWLVIAIPVGGIALSLSFRTVLANNFDERLQTTLLLLMGAADQSADGAIVLARPINDPRFNQVYSGWYWMIRHEDRTLRSRSTWDLPLKPRAAKVSGAPSFRYDSDLQGHSLRLAEQTVRLPGARSATTFAVAGDVAELHREINHFNRLLWLSLSALALGLIAAIAAQVTVGLRPLRRVAADVAQVRSGIKQRLNESGLSEIDTLVSQVNTLIEQDREQLKRARANAADLAHSLKTPLAVLRSSLNESDERFEHVVAIQRTVERQLARAASAGPRESARTHMAEVIGPLISGMRKIHADRHLIIEAGAVSAARVAVDREDLEEMLGNLLDNACKWASSRVHMTVTTHGRVVQVQVADDGPGMTQVQAMLATERGRRFDNSVQGSGLGLAIVEDLAALYAGSLHLNRSEWGGTEAVLQLPAA